MDTTAWLAATLLVAGCGTSSVAADPFGSQGGGTSAAGETPTVGETSNSPSSSTSSATGESGGPDSSGDNDGVVLDVGDDSTDTDVSPGLCECEDVDDGIYVLSEAPSELWFYDPVTHTFSMLGTLECPAFASFSMGVDRRGIAWINYLQVFGGISGQLHNARVDAPADCAEADFTSPSGFGMVGMAFASNGMDDNCDKLYMLTGDDGSGTGALGRLDPQTLTMEVVGPIDLGLGELSGTGDGRLFAFAGGAATEPASLHRLDKDAAIVEETIPLPGLATTTAFAFAFWGGDFYFFTESTPNGPSTVTRLDYDGSDGGGLTPLPGVAPIRVVGAGVSTCASLAPEG